MRSPSDVIGLVILQNSFVFLALFLALVLKERRVSTSPVFTQNRLLKSSISYIKTYGFVKDSTTIELSPPEMLSLHHWLRGERKGSEMYPGCSKLDLYWML